MSIEPPINPSVQIIDYAPKQTYNQHSLNLCNLQLISIISELCHFVICQVMPVYSYGVVFHKVLLIVLGTLF